MTNLLRLCDIPPPIYETVTISVICNATFVLNRNCGIYHHKTNIIVLATLFALKQAKFRLLEPILLESAYLAMSFILQLLVSAS